MWSKRFTLSICCFSLLLLSIGCGGGSDLGSEEVPQMRIADSTPEVISLQQHSTGNRPQMQTRVIVDSTGAIPLEIQRFELIDTPNRLVPVGETLDQGCEYSKDANRFDGSGNCTSGQFCWYSTQECRVQGFPETPIEIPANQQKQFELVVQPGDGNLNCPTPEELPETVPSNITTDSYCGRLEIETNAGNNAGIVEGGTATIYFISSEQAQSGRIEVSPTSLSFDGIEPGGSQTQTLNVSNTGESDLRIFNVSFTDHQTAFSVSGASFPASISAGSSKSLDVTFSPSADWSSDQIDNLGVFLDLQTSARNVSGGVKPVSINASTKSSIPVVEMKPSTVSFADSSSQTVTITNKGSVPVVLRAISTTPSAAANFYQYQSNGSTIEGNFSNGLLDPEESRQITITYATGAESSAEAIGELEITYNVPELSQTGQVNATLTGQVTGSGIGFVTPSQFTFAADGGEAQSRTFVIRNVGDQPLNINGVSDTSGTRFSTSGVPDAIPAGGLKKATVNFENGVNETSQDTLIFDSNTAGPPLELFVLAQPTEGSSNVNAKINAQFSGEATVGEPVVFSASGSTLGDEGQLQSARWFLTGRPSGSGTFVDRSGETIAIVPDEPGTYELSLLINDGDHGSQATHEFTVVE